LLKKVTHLLNNLVKKHQANYQRDTIQLYHAQLVYNSLSL